MEKWKYNNRRPRCVFISLDYLEKYKILKPDYAIGCTTDGFYLIFGNNLDGCGIYLDEDRQNTKISLHYFWKKIIQLKYMIFLLIVI